MTQVKERGIIFNLEMVRAILDGRKTQTRRVIKPLPRLLRTDYPPDVPVITEHWTIPNRGDGTWVCPYGQIGDRLWVRETWSVDDYIYIEYEDRDKVYYMADEEHPEMFPRKRPSIHMPKWASRITLEITNVRVERLQEISEEDAVKEGAEKMHLDDLGQTWKTYNRGFQSLWESIHGQGSWSLNQFVWVIEFRRVE
jgi:hypothetical protein